MRDAVVEIIEQIRERVTPDTEERAALEDALSKATERAERAIADLPVEADILHLGSTARNTWLAGDRDIDVFVRFPVNLDREELERYGLEVGHAVLPQGHEEYAEHPYVVGDIDSFQVDLVPCYDVDDPTLIRSAVDRTPFHNEYLQERLDDELAAEVRVAKQFLTGIGAYGSDLRTRGFSGFLVELLILEYGSFRVFCERAADWHPPVRHDPANHGQIEFDDPLIVVDPTDPERNVAAVCSEENVARFQHYARELLSAPSADLFEPRQLTPIAASDLKNLLDLRESTPVALRFESPDLVEDQLYPQLEKSLDGVTGGLERHGFDVLRSATWAKESAVIYVDLAVSQRPYIERHEGPPVHVREHASTFFDIYAGNEDVTGPFLSDSRYVVERPREFTTAVDFLDSEELLSVGLGTSVESALEAGYDIHVGEAVVTLADEFGSELAAFYDPKP